MRVLAVLWLGINLIRQSICYIIPIWSGEKLANSPIIGFHLGPVRAMENIKLYRVIEFFRLSDRPTNGEGRLRATAR